MPNGEIKKVGNFSQGWSQAILDIEVAEDADLADTERTIEKAARELMDDPDLGPRIMAQPQVWGVERISDGAVALRLVVRTTARARWRVEREARARVKQALEKRNVPLKAVS